MAALALIHHIVDGSVHAVAIALNVLLLVVIYNADNDMLKRYKNVFLLTCTSDLVCAVITFICQPAFFVNGDIAIILSNGFLSQVPPGFVLGMLVAYNTTMAANMAFLSVPFVYRYWIMCRDDKAKWLLTKLCTLPALISLISIYTSYKMFDCDRSFQADADATLRSLPWNVDNEAVDQRRLFGFRIGLTDLSMLPHVALVGMTNFVSYSCIIWSEVRVIRKTNLSAKLMRRTSIYNRKLQSGLTKALTALAVCPAVSSLVPVGCFLVVLVFKLNLSAVSPLLFILVSSITVVNPITTCYFVTSFRKTLLRLLRCDKVLKRRSSSIDSDVQINVF